MSPRHHMRHHLDDNVNYAFLNGMTDPLLNVIARPWFSGYKQKTDAHYATFLGQGSDKRAQPGGTEPSSRHDV